MENNKYNFKNMLKSNFYKYSKFINKYPLANGTFIQADMVKKWNDSKWQSEFHYLKEAKMHYVVMGTSITEGNVTKTIYPTKIPAGKMEYPNVDIVDMCLRNAEKSGIKVFLGINFNADWWKKAAREPNWLYAQMERGNLIADELYTKYHFKYPNSFYGWYWVYEVDNLNFRTKEQFSILSNAININLKHLKEKNHRLPFMLSPFMNSKYGTPKEYAKNWAYLFQNTDLGNGDIFCPQDSVGGGGLNINEVADWFCELRSAVNTKPGILFWANTETFNHFDWSSATLDRFIKQMKIESKYVDDFITFAYSHYYSPNNIHKGFHKTYLDYVKKGYLEKQAPTKPAKVTVKKIGLNKFLINWEASKDNMGVYEYIVYRNKKVIFNTKVQRIYGGVNKGITMTFTDNPPLKERFKKLIYGVRAVDFAGNVSLVKREERKVKSFGEFFSISLRKIFNFVNLDL
ncbi:hypothetical protein CLOACE_14040 [Clostridium acetireducens DSM 10703]|uniref:DUF4434 domain-containing protein n=1 Tax=Clostridium acetireducens DSM 10703 TaxID=1121290 RepID=A0A1E8EYL1_9CLOT|nr:DUF4434 domain-containing protein [Clostridium acetireducens]OFI05929.1 hypothetical protein CLOACE_14040 [Clostridium acetireducens DSM 10703]